MVEVRFTKSPREQNNIKTALMPVIFLGQAAGIFPNLQGKGLMKKILLILYSLFSGLGTFSLMMYYVFLKWEYDKAKHSSLHSLHLAQIIFLYGSITCNFILYLRLSIYWPSLVEKWYRIDADLFRDHLYGYPWYLKRLSAAIILYSCVLPGGQAFVVHFMYYSKLKSVPQNNGSVSFTDMSQAMFPQLKRVFAFLWYPLGICLHSFLVVHFNFVDGFIEGFIMVVSANLASRLRQLTNFARTRHTNVSTNRRQLSWVNIRKDYTRLCNLTFRIDDQICLITLCSYIRIFTFLLNVFTSVLQELKTPEDKLYCFYSGFYNSAKLISLTMFSAWVNEESTKILKVVNSASSEDYRTEVRRFALQISFDEVALTGNRMFKIKKNLILKVISAVVTYELIVIQYKRS